MILLGELQWKSYHNGGRRRGLGEPLHQGVEPWPGQLMEGLVIHVGSPSDHCPGTIQNRGWLIIQSSASGCQLFGVPGAHRHIAVLKRL